MGGKDKGNNFLLFPWFYFFFLMRRIKIYSKKIENAFFKKRIAFF